MTPEQAVEYVRSLSVDQVFDFLMTIKDILDDKLKEEISKKAQQAAQSSIASD